MAQAKLKTKPTKQSVATFLAAIPDAERRADCKKVMAIMKRVTGAKPKMWGPSIVGFGQYHYKYPSGHEGDMCIAGFSSRKPDLVVYIMDAFPGRAALMKRLGTFKTGKVCLYMRRLSDVDQDVLAQLVEASVEAVTRKYG